MSISKITAEAAPSRSTCSAATGIRMVQEIVTQLRGEAGVRQVKDARIGLAQCAGFGGVFTVFILKK